MGQRKLGFNVCPGAGSAQGSCAHLLVAGLYTVAAASAGCYSAEYILPVVTSVAATATEFLACHDMVDVAALHM